MGRDVGLSPEACVAQTEMIRLADSDELLVASLGSLDKWTWPSDSGQQRGNAEFGERRVRTERRWGPLVIKDRLLRQGGLED